MAFWFGLGGVLLSYIIVGSVLWELFVQVLVPFKGGWGAYDSQRPALMQLWYVIFGAASAPFIWAVVAITVKRFHDLNKSGFWILVFPAPLLIQLIITLIYPRWGDSLSVLFILALLKYGGFLCNLLLLLDLGTHADRDKPPANETAKDLPSTEPMGEAASFNVAVFQGDLERVKALLTENPELLSIRDHDGRTPLHWAAMNGHRTVAELLLLLKAALDAKDRWGMTATDYALKGHYDDLARLLGQRMGCQPEATES
jgi:uncharacterized membrane protein YhaH (DUF805 family)